jgi:hypothetical protein
MRYRTGAQRNGTADHRAPCRASDSGAGRWAQAPADAGTHSVRQHLDDPFGGCPFHFGGCSRSRPRTSAMSCGDDAIRSGQSEEGVRPELARDWTFRVVAEREAGNAEKRRLLLNPAGVRQHPCRVSHESQELDVADRLGDLDVAVAVPHAQRFERGLGARICGKDHRHLLGQPLELRHGLEQQRGVFVPD